MIEGGEMSGDKRKAILCIGGGDVSISTALRMLQSRGYVILMARSGEAGLSAAVDKQPDLILLDISLPDIDGCLVASRLKEDKELSAIPIVAFTAIATRDEKERILEAGCDLCVTKPVDIPELSDHVGSFLSAPTAQPSWTRSRKSTR